MKKLIIFLALLPPCFAATVFRVDPQAVTTVAGNAPPGGYPALYAVPGATINVCTDAACSIAATTYADSTGNTACPNTAQVVLAGTTLCTPTTGPQGQFGFWLAIGSTFYYTVTLPTGQRFGPFPVSSSTAGAATVTGGAGISCSPTSGAVVCTNTGVLSFNARTGAVVPTTGDYTAAQVTNAVDTTQTYSNPSWLTGLNISKLLGLTADTFVQGTSGNPQAGAFVNCVSAGGVYNYSTSSHTFSCHTLAGADIPQIALGSSGNGGVGGTLLPVNGGSGVSSPTAHGTLIAEGSSPFTAVAPNTAGFVLTSNGGSADPSYQAPQSVLPSASAQLQQLIIAPNTGNLTTTAWANPTLVDATRYNWTSQTPGGSLSIGNNTITLTPCPLGVNWNDPRLRLYISGGTGTAESVPVVSAGPGTCLGGGTSSGTITVTAAHTHSGAWTIQSSFAGIYEAIAANPFREVRVPAGVYNFLDCMSLSPTQSLVLTGDGYDPAGSSGTIIAGAAVTSSAGCANASLISEAASPGFPINPVTIRNMLIVGNGTSTPVINGVNFTNA